MLRRAVPFIGLSRPMTTSPLLASTSGQGGGVPLTTPAVPIRPLRQSSEGTYRVPCSAAVPPSVGAVATHLHNPVMQRRWTTILCVRKNNRVVLMGDQLATKGQAVKVKTTVKKLRKASDHVICGFAGSTADAITLLEKLEGKLSEHSDLTRACVELAKDWRGDKMLRRLEASMIVASASETLEIDGSGNVLVPDDGIMGIGSGGLYAKAAARALIDVEGLTADEIALKAMTIAVNIDCFSNSNFDKMALDFKDEKPAGLKKDGEEDKKAKDNDEADKKKTE